MELLALLKKCNITTLPINLTGICSALGVEITTYESYGRYRSISEEVLCQRFFSDAFTLSNGRRTLIVYNQRQHHLGRRRFSFAHEIGHILLGHLGDGACEGDSPYTSMQREREADDFAINLLAPLPVLHLMGLSTAEEIRQVCDISQRAADNRLRELMVMRREQRELSALEADLVLQFLPFIHQHHCKGTAFFPLRHHAKSIDL